jgi:plasmid stabilization system protein ParE
MRQPTIDAVLGALAQHSARDIAAAIYARQDVAVVERLIDALTDATMSLATYPHAGVIAEADALLYETLRSPLADAVPAGAPTPGPAQVAAHLGITGDQAASLLARIHASDPDAAQALVASGLDPNWTLEQQQVMTCIRQLLAHGVAPTRARVVARATAHARAALRPGDGTEPFIRAADPSLPPRILSSSPMALVPAWMARMDARPPAVGLARDRIAYLQAAKATLARSSAAQAAVHRLLARRPQPVMGLTG